MIEARELRIGNFLLFEDNSVIEVRGIHPSGKNIHDGKKWIEVFRLNPISLTEDWLLKFGFEYEQDGFDGVNKSFITLLRVGGNHSIYQLSIKEIAILTFIESVHQLQNLYFALTGTELTIK